MKIRNLKIRNYKIFDDIDIDFTNKEGEAINKIVLAGINGTGKTTILELILSSFVETIRDNNYNKAEYFGIDLELLPNELKSFKEFLTNNDDNELLKYGILTKNRLQLSVAEIEKDFIQNEENELEEVVNLIIPDTINTFKEFFTAKKTGFKVAYLHDFTNTIDIKKRSALKLLDFNKFEENLEVYFKQVITDKLFNNRNITAAEVIKSEIDKINNILEGIKTMSKIDDIDNNKLIFRNFKGDKLLPKDLSAGEKQLFYRAIYLSALNLNNTIILVDEPELSLHPTWQKYILKLYENIGENNQLIIATHSPHIISSTNPENLFCLYTNDKTKKIEIVNLNKAGKHTKGVEPNRILNEIMQTPLRDYETQKKIDYVARNLKKELATNKMQELIKELTDNLGHADPFIIRLKNQILLLNRKKSK